MKENIVIEPSQLAQINTKNIIEKLFKVPHIDKTFTGGEFVVSPPYVTENRVACADIINMAVAEVNGIEKDVNFLPDLIHGFFTAKQQNSERVGELLIISVGLGHLLGKMVFDSKANIEMVSGQMSDVLRAVRIKKVSEEGLGTHTIEKIGQSLGPCLDTIEKTYRGIDNTQAREYAMATLNKVREELGCQKQN